MNNSHKIKKIPQQESLIISVRPSVGTYALTDDDDYALLLLTNFNLHPF
jgi:hypothetical protein